MPILEGNVRVYGVTRVAIGAFFILITFFFLVNTLIEKPAQA